MTVLHALLLGLSGGFLIGMTVGRWFGYQFGHFDGIEKVLGRPPQYKKWW